MHSPLVYQLALSQIPLIGSVLSKNLLSYCGSAEAVFAEKMHSLLKIPGIGKQSAREVLQFKDFDRMAQEEAFILQHGIKATFFSDPEYPRRLKSNADAPLLLFSKGAFDYNAPSMIGVVGTRKNSGYGRDLTEKLIEDLKDTGCTIVSGMAYGIDIIAHKKALKVGLPTIGVLAHGLDRIYPSMHNAVAREMSCGENGLITEFISKTQPDRENFPSRNRIVAGLVDAIVVVESKIKGGSMISADLAFQYDREVMVFPGRITDENSAGCHMLLKLNKAHLIESASDLKRLMNYYPPEVKSQQTKLILDLSDDEMAIVNHIRQHRSLSLDALMALTGFHAGKLAQLLLMLEINDLVRPLPGKFYELR